MVVQSFTGIRRQLRKKVPVDGSTGGTGFTSVPDGYETGTIEVSIDVAAIARELGSRAMGNKSGKAKYMKGAVVIRVVKRERVSV